MHFTEQTIGRQQLLRISGDDTPIRIEHFDPEYLKAQNLLFVVMHGRGETWLFNLNELQLVLKHYRRGGKAAALKDRYGWTGLHQTRAWLEFKLLTELYEAGLPVPKPVAARVERAGLFYRADLITQCIPGVQPLSQVLREKHLPAEIWQKIGSVIRRFHHHQANHADLNSHNILISEKEVFLIDFDKSAIIKRTGKERWKQDNLDRLYRSLEKIKKQDKAIHFDKKDWNALLQGYNTIHEKT